jgi:hypothetical protein
MIRKYRRQSKFNQKYYFHVLGDVRMKRTYGSSANHCMYSAMHHTNRSDEQIQDLRYCFSWFENCCYNKFPTSDGYSAGKLHLEVLILEQKFRLGPLGFEYKRREPCLDFGDPLISAGVPVISLLQAPPARLKYSITTRHNNL